jgi:alpha-N-acetylglucosamine transferase
MKEIWKDIPDYEGLYQISNLGRVKSLDRITRNGNGNFTKKGRILKNIINNKGYYYVHLKKEGSNKKIYVHRLVAQAFIPNKNNKEEVNHIDCNPANNKVDNLEWVTHKENMGYMAKLGHSNKTGKWLEKIRCNNIMNGKKVLQIDCNTKKIIKTFKTIQSVKEDGFLPSSVCHCCKGIRKKHKGYIWRYANDRDS